MLVEMNLRGVLVKACRELMLGLLDRHPVEMIDLLAHLVVSPAIRTARKCRVISSTVEVRQSSPKGGGFDHLFQLWHMRRVGGGCFVAFANHDPAHIVQYWRAVLIDARRANIDHAALLIGVLTQPDHFRRRGQRISWKHRLYKTAFRITKISNGVERDIR